MVTFPVQIVCLYNILSFRFKNHAVLAKYFAQTHIFQRSEKLYPTLVLPAATLIQFQERKYDILN